MGSKNKKAKKSQAAANIADAMVGAMHEESARLATSAHDDLYSQLFEKALTIDDDTIEEALAEVYADYMEVARAGHNTNVHLMLARTLMLVRAVYHRASPARALESEVAAETTQTLTPTPTETEAEKAKVGGTPLWVRPHGEVGVGVPPHQRR